MSGLTQPAWSLKIYQALRKYHRQIPFDIIEFSNWKAQGLIHSLHKIAPQAVRVTTTIRQVTSLAEMVPSSNRYYPRILDWLERVAISKLEFLEALAVRRSDLIIVPAWGHWRAVAHHYLLSSHDEARAVYIPFGTDVSRNRLPRDLSKSRPCRLLYVGRLTRRKGFDIFMMALPTIFARAAYEVQVTIIGQDSFSEPEGVSAWQKYSSQLDVGIRQHIEFLGPVSDIDRENAYRNCDVFVAPSRYESFGLMYIEAMCYGIPVIGCRVGGIPEVIDDEVNGFLIEPGDASTLANSVLRLLNNPVLRQQMGKAARLSVLNQFNRQQMAQATVDAYLATLSKPVAQTTT
jgi:glycosyltransferase involved in cell wall biosynthesis